MYELGSSYTFDFLSFILILSGITGLLVGIYLYKFKETPGTLYLSVLHFATAIWSITYCLEYSALDLDLKLFWSKLSYLGIPNTMVWFFLFSLKFNNPNKKINPLWFKGLISFSVLLFLIVITNDYHHLHWADAFIDTQINTTIYEYGKLFWVTYSIIYVLFGWGILNVFRVAIKATDYHNTPVWAIVLATFFPITGNLIYVFKVNPISGFDWTPVSFLITGIILTVINIRYSTFNLIPYARNKIFDLMEDGIFIIDDKHRIVDMNKTFLNLFNRKEEEVIGRNIYKVFPNKFDLIRELYRKETVSNILILTETTEKPMNMDVQVVPLFDNKGICNGRLVVLRDVTDKIQNEKELKRINDSLKAEIAEKEKLIVDLDAFAHTVAHDLRDSIGGVASAANLIAFDIENKEYDSAIETTKLMVNSSDKSLHVINELLTMATVRQQDIELVQTDMGKIIVETERRLNQLIQQYHVEIIKPDSWPTIKSNPGWLEEVWVNYISNAIKYGGEKPIVELGFDVISKENKVRFWVKDNGDGISRENQQRLFKKYSRLEVTRVEGTGLGLSIVKRIVEKMEGEVGVWSKAAKNEGSLFYFILPFE